MSEFMADHPTVKYKLKSPGHATKGCQSPLTITTKTPISPSSRWIFTATCPNKWSATLSAKTSVKYDFYISTKTIFKGEMIGHGNTKKNTKWFGKKVSGLNKVFGYKAKKTIKPNTVLAERHLSPNYIVNKKQSIRVMTSSKNSSITISAIAMESGLKYDIIKVMNPGSRKVFYAKILSPTTAVVE